MTREELIEASIDHMTRQRYRDVVALERMHAQSRYKASPDTYTGYPGKFIGSHTTRAKRLDRRRDIDVVTNPDIGVEGSIAGFHPPETKNRQKIRKLARARMLELPPPQRDAGTRRHIKSVIAHELMHAHDPGDRLRKGRRPGRVGANVSFRSTPKDPSHYFASTKERHAHSAVAGSLGVRDLRKTGVTGAQARAFLRRGGDISKEAAKSYKAIGKLRRSENRTRTPRQMIAWRGAWTSMVSPAENYRKLLASKTKKHRKAGQKFFKEIHKGMERQYGRGYAAKRKLPEEARAWLNNLK